MNRDEAVILMYMQTQSAPNLVFLCSSVLLLETNHPFIANAWLTRYL